MATNNIKSPNPQAYSSDPLQQIYAKGTLDRDMSGLSYMFKNAADTRQDQQIASYEQGLSEANQMSAALTQQQMAQENAMAIIKASTGLMEKGYAPSGMKASGAIFNDPNANDQFSQATLAKLLAEAATANAKGASEGQDKWQYDLDISPAGIATGRWTGKGNNPSRLEAMMNERALASTKARGLTPSSAGPLALPDRNAPNTLPARYR